jgi:hypothetical protein
MSEKKMVWDRYDSLYHYTLRGLTLYNAGRHLLKLHREAKAAGWQDLRLMMDGDDGDDHMCIRVVGMRQETDEEYEMRTDKEAAILKKRQKEAEKIRVAKEMARNIGKMIEDSGVMDNYVMESEPDKQKMIEYLTDIIENLQKHQNNESEKS